MSNRKSKKPSLFKRISAWLHLWLGLVSGLIVFIVGITGSVYVFQKEITDMLEPWRTVPPQAARTLAPSELITIAAKQFPGKRVQFTRYEEGKAAYAGLSGKGYSYGLYIHPYTGTVLKTKNFTTETNFFSFVLRGHRTLWLPAKIGRPIVDGAILVFVVLLITGIVLWWPKKWNKTGRRLSFRINWKASFKRTNYDLHKVPGFYAMLLLLVISVTGLAFGYQWVSRGIYFLASGGSSVPVSKRPSSDTTAATRSPAPIDALFWKYYTGKGLLFVFNAEKKSDPLQVTCNPDASTNHAIVVHYHDRYTLKELPSTSLFAVDFSRAGTAAQINRLNYDIHTGQVGGWFTKLLVCILGLIAASLPVTGFLIWWGRRHKTVKSRATAVPVAPSSHSTAGTATLHSPSV